MSHFWTVSAIAICLLAYAYRICDPNGTWYNNWTNYTECLQILVNNESEYSWGEPSQSATIRRMVISIMFFCSIVSLALLLMTLFIFFYFKTLSSCRIRVHRHLVIALIIHSALCVIIAWPHLYASPAHLTSPPTTTNVTSNSNWFDDWRVNDYLCKGILFLKLYSTLASINWMFIEGLLLHSRITVSVFRKDAPFKLYYFIGWGLPLILVSIWATKMSLDLPSHCWTGYGDSVYIWIIVGPMVVALLINCIFLVNIIRVLLTKLTRDTVTLELNQIRKAIKATALLFPLLGISHLLFCINPDDDGQLEDAYMIVNAFLQSSQGIFVAILYCFMDSEVQTVLRNTYQRNTAYSGGGHYFGFPWSGWSRNTSTLRNRSYLSHTSISVYPPVSPNGAATPSSILELRAAAAAAASANGFHSPPPPALNGLISNGNGHHHILTSTAPALSKHDPNHFQPPTPPKKTGRSSSFKFRQPTTTNGSLNSNSTRPIPPKPRTCIVFNSTSGQMVRFTSPRSSKKKSPNKNGEKHCSISP